MEKSRNLIFRTLTNQGKILKSRKLVTLIQISIRKFPERENKSRDEKETVSLRDHCGVQYFSGSGEDWDPTTSLFTPSTVHVGFLPPFRVPQQLAGTTEGNSRHGITFMYGFVRAFSGECPRIGLRLGRLNPGVKPIAGRLRYSPFLRKNAVWTIIRCQISCFLKLFLLRMKSCEKLWGFYRYKGTKPLTFFLHTIKNTPGEKLGVSLCGVYIAPKRARAILPC